MLWVSSLIGGVILLGSLASCIRDEDVRNLIGEPDYRKVSLHWEVASANEEIRPHKSRPVLATVSGTFQVRYCELQTWGAQRCRTKIVSAPRLPATTTSPAAKESDQANVVNIDDSAVVYETDIGGLRMATTYSFEVHAVEEGGAEALAPSNRGDASREYRPNGAAVLGSGRSENVIVIPTKGFSAKATQCLPHASEIEVSTGPHFAGRIAVEAADGERCAIDGQADSSRDTYTLRINHDECGSQVNETTVATFVLVQENLPILTHSTRRFLVLCSYQPETLTVRAGINLPTNHHHHHHSRGQAKITMEDGPDTYGKRRGSGAGNNRMGRHLQRPEALVNDDDAIDSDDALNEPHGNSAAGDGNSVLPVALIVVLMVAAVACLVALALRWNLRSMRQDLDNLSVASDLSTASNFTTVETGSTAGSVTSASISHCHDDIRQQ